MDGRPMYRKKNITERGCGSLDVFGGSECGLANAAIKFCYIKGGKLFYHLSGYQVLRLNPASCMTSGFLRRANNVFALLEY
jgi:hypothetical protein